MSSVIDQYEDILTKMVELKSEGDSKCSSKATSHTKELESFGFYYMPCGVAFDRYILAAHVFLKF